MKKQRILSAMAAFLVLALGMGVFGWPQGGSGADSARDGKETSVGNGFALAEWLTPRALAETEAPPAEQPQEAQPTQPDASLEPAVEPPEGQEDAKPTEVPAEEANSQPTPAPRLAGLKIGIDPGHQGHGNSEQEPVSPGSKETKPKVSSGTQGRSTGTPEHVVNLDVSMKLRDALIAQGAEVLMTRETADVDISNVERAQMMNEWGADLVLRIHCNGVDSSSANGIGLYVRKTGAKAEECLEAAKIIIPHMVEATGAREDGVFRRDVYSGLNWSEVPSILVEMGYMSNKKEDELLNSDEYQKKLVHGMVEGIADYFERGAYASQPLEEGEPEWDDNVVGE